MAGSNHSAETRLSVPFTVIGGFLGAGKTTLLNHVLQTSNKIRYAVLVNDFGKINIDESLIASHDGQTLTLANGCICCSLADGFITTMIRLMEQQETFDHIIVEASGVSNPDRIMDFARLDPQLVPCGIIVLVDSNELQQRLKDPSIETIVKTQLNAASLLLVNKTDLASPEDQQTNTSILTNLNPTAKQLSCSHSNLPVELLLGPDPDSQLKSDSGDIPDTNPDPHTNFFSVTLSTVDAVERPIFQKAIATLDVHILRGKGILRFADDPNHAWVWQRVGNQNAIAKLSDKMPATAQLVLIGTEEIILPSALRALFSDES